MTIHDGTRTYRTKQDHKESNNTIQGHTEQIVLNQIWLLITIQGPNKIIKDLRRQCIQDKSRLNKIIPDHKAPYTNYSLTFNCPKLVYMMVIYDLLKFSSPTSFFWLFSIWYLKAIILIYLCLTNSPDRPSSSNTSQYFRLLIFLW